jgi:hypothetical protein
VYCFCLYVGGHQLVCVLYCVQSIGLYREAAEAAVELKDEAPLRLLEEIRAKATDRQDQYYITQLMQRFAGK